jgi:hypothetical protein
MRRLAIEQSSVGFYDIATLWSLPYCRSEGRLGCPERFKVQRQLALK